ncbi:glyoxalase/bleomycin resistance protein/dioxygenase superfamily protein [Variovorax sp. 54]|uniref:VOC family protein n=1 Tax=Variovorax sp. 54 TaxID=2035212 RepID=UPI000C188322|nr:VOC family protein [Variovorax sp. 54]PIF76004.1 glyoxalase/bleomycin resistance protein/dioxygenase superfamily protein [Variovorax sp. 54]
MTRPPAPSPVVSAADAAPFAVLRIDHVVLRVRDAARAMAFYCDVLGCTLEKRRDDLGLVHLRAGSSLIDLVTHDGKLGSQGGALAGREGRNVDHLCLRIEPFDEAAIRARMARHGVPVHGEVQNNFGAEGSGPSIYLEDPDGNGVELKGPAA